MTAAIALHGAAGAAPTPAANAGPGLPHTVDTAAFPTQATIRKLVRKEMSFGLRFPGSKSQKQELKWLEKQLRAIPGATIAKQAHRTPFWLPTTKAKRGVSLDLVKAGGLSVSAKGKTMRLPVASAVPFSKPTPREGGKRGRLVRLPAGQDITRANAKGRIVIRDFQEGSIPYDALRRR